MRTALLALALATLPLVAHADAPTLEAPSVLLGGVEAELKVAGLEVGAPYVVRIDGREHTSGTAESAELSLPLTLPSGTHSVVLSQGTSTARAELRAVPSFLALLPPIVAIVLALLLRQVLLALFAGVLVGAFVTQGYDPAAAFVRTIDQYAVGAAADADHASILIFSLLLGGMIGVITRAGGAAGLAAAVTKRATNSMRGQLAAWALGLVVFFDDYANSLLVGSSMRPITDRLRVSREKLAFLVDATSAPVASLALVSSWIGVEVGYIGEELESANVAMDPYVAFLETLPYRFYPWLMLFFVLLIVLSRRDFGPMLKAERRAREKGELVRPGARPASDFAEALPDVPPRILVATLPILATLLVAIGGMVVTGRAAVLAEGGEPTLRAVFGSANSYHALLWASAVGGLVAVITAIATRAMALGHALDAWTEGLKSMLLACVILVMAWSLGALCKELHTADVVVSAVGRGLPVGLLGTVVFLVAAAVSFATGTSWGTMAILFPLVVPLAVELAPGNTPILLGAISSILAGSVWGDHCSPISDTTIMSSMASSCDHVDHVHTQIPYALLVGVVSIVVCELPTGFGLYPAWVALPLGALVLFLIVRFVGQKVPDHDPR
ncbi:MAG: Na+/H+ antiporter NhaC family protein [Sandaracinus sp.]|nr:Na+/H+ antiporter NhaC family protein [Myxococcales bacterium]MCB9625099.1 Na+/H+ antiporter NhaC family protein [Sandaracinus sp.]MCB9633098.1 Na+/H+ antiporter NhaC family protein [Sandaracinus sp.]